MHNKIKNCSLALLFVLSSCGTPDINEKYAAEVVKKELAISKVVTAQLLRGDKGGKTIFLATDGSMQYVARFITKRPQKHLEQEIYNLKIASNGDFGPKIYFADAARGIIVMEYLPGKKISPQDFQSDQFYVALAHLLQKMHRGQAFANSEYDVFKRINKHLQNNKPKFGNYVPLTQLEEVISTIHQALLPHLTNTTPCHNDLHGGNLIFLGQEFKAIDYEDAGQCDPYDDIATVAASTCAYSQPAHEKVLFTTYLERQPSKIEEAKLYLMKQVVLIRWALNALNNLARSPETAQQYNSLNVPNIIEIERKQFEGKIDSSKPENNLTKLKVFLNQVFENFKTQEFIDAIDTLKQKQLNYAAAAA